MPDHWFVFDVESVGLHGDAFAFGWVVVDASGREKESGYESCDPDMCSAGARGDREWVAANVPQLIVSTQSPQGVRAAFWYEWRRARARWPGIAMAADCPWPVEARFLLDGIRDEITRAAFAPYPLYDVAMFLADPTATYERMPEEMPPHHPLADARQSARLLTQAIARQERA